jgi:hypothetical protein
MATIKIDYSQFKASGVYTLEFDASESVILNTQTIRLIVGFSRVGPFNAPAYLPDKKTAKKIFGDIDTFLERRGSFFHRAIYTALDQNAPVFGLNLLPLNNDPDTGDYAPYMSYSLSMTERNGVPTSRPYASYFNKQRFWKADEDYLLGNVNFAGSINAGKLFNIVNVSQTPVSVLVKKADPADVAQFNITAREFYGVGNVPTYIDEYDYISDYFVNVFIVPGKWNDYRRLAVDPVFSEYFDLRGLKKDKRREFLATPEVGQITSFQGCVLPDLTDGLGINHSLDVVAKNILAETGILIAIDKSALEQYDPKVATLDDFDTISAVDMVGNTLADPNRENPEIIDFLSYRTTIKESTNFPMDDTINMYKQSENGVVLNIGEPVLTTSSRIGRDYGYLNNVIRIKRPAPDATVFTELEYLELYSGIVPGFSLIKLDGVGNKWGLIQAKQVFVTVNQDTDAEEEYLHLTYSHPNKAYETLAKGAFFYAQVPSPSNLATFQFGILERTPVLLASTGTNVDLTPGFFPLTLDGVTIPNNARVLLKDQTNPIENGVYVVNTGTSTATRATDFDQTLELAFSSFFYVQDGIINYGRGFALSSQNAIIGVNDLVFVEYTKPALTFIKNLMPKAYVDPLDDKFADPTWWPAVGRDFLVENKVSRLFYYLKAAEPVMYLDGGERVVVNLESAAIPALQRIAAAPLGYTANIHSEEIAKLDQLQIVFRPDMLKWVSPVGSRGGLSLIAADNTTSAMTITITKLLSALPNDLVGDSITASQFSTPSFYPKTTSTLNEYGALRLENVVTGKVVFLQVRRNVLMGDYTNTLTNSNLSLNVIDNLAMDEIVLNPLDWKVSWAQTEANHYVAYKFNKLHEFFDASVMLPGDRYFYTSNNSYFLDYQLSSDKDGVPILKLYAFDSYNTNTLNFDNTPSRGINSGWFMTPYAHYLRGEGLPVDVYDSNDGGINIYGAADKFYDDIDIIAYNPLRTKFTVSKALNNTIKIGDYIVSEQKDENNLPVYKMTRVINKIALPDGTFQFELNLPAKINVNGTLLSVTRYVSIDSFISNYQFIYLSGFKLTDFHLPGNRNTKAAQQRKILEMLDPINSNLREMLSEKDIIDFRYIVDTFDGTIEPMTGAKVQLTRLARDRQKCLAIMNAPRVQEFIDSNEPRFSEPPSRLDPVPIFQARYIPDGGNLALGPQNRFSLPDEDNGAKFAGYFTPFLRIRENGKSILVPPAANVSNLFIRKFQRGEPYAIVAGSRRGIISDPKLVNLEYEYLTSERKFIEPFGLNPIIFKKGIGNVIYGNQMAYQRTPSAFNNLHVRDLLITIEDSIEQILENFLFEFNDTTTRLEVKTLVDGYLSGVQSARGIYAYLTIMDESNNPPSIIDQNMGIIDVYVEPARGIHKFLNRVTVLKTGGIAAGGFNNFI